MGHSGYKKEIIPEVETRCDLETMSILQVRVECAIDLELDIEDRYR